ncbi:MAG: fatty acid-binding protein DegV [Bacillales bacterium]|jgi:DegV family protein with EDD domain|nr:fatty acid-binding protein DegV [Bacillales bacterium]
MTKIKIVTDSTADISKALAEQLDIQVVPLNVTIDGETYLDGIDFTPSEFIEKMKQSKELPKSSQPSVGAFAEVFEKIKGEDVEILCITISQKLSGTYQSASMATEVAEANVTLFSSDFVTAPLKTMVLEAVEMANRGCTMEEIVARLTEIRQNIKLLIAVDTLDNLIKGGRIGKAAGMIGSFLNIKPILTIQDGVIVPAEKVRSTGQVIKYFIKCLTEDLQGKTLKAVTIVSVGSQKNAQTLVEEIKKVAPVDQIEIIEATSVLATHTGEGTLAINYLAE